MDSTSYELSNTDTEDESKKAHIERFKFSGSGKEYFGIWIVNILLTIVTLGIYSAWAKVRNQQYFYGNTSLQDSSFEYTAKPIQILKSRILAVVVFVFYNIASQTSAILAIGLPLLLLIASPWIIMRSLAFNAHVSKYRGISFGFHQSTWDAYQVFLIIPLGIFLTVFAAIGGATYVSGSGNMGLGFMAILFLLPLIIALVYFLAYPFLLYISCRYVYSNYTYGHSSFRFRVRSMKPFYIIYAKAGALVLLSMLFAYLLFKGMGGAMDLANIEYMESDSPLAFVSIIVFYVGFGIFYGAIIAYLKARTYNLVYQNIALENHKLRAKMRATPLAYIIITNTVFIALTLGLFIPWAKVRLAKFYADNTAMQVWGDLSEFINKESEYQNAMGEELGEVFDVGFGV